MPHYPDGIPVRIRYKVRPSNRGIIESRNGDYYYVRLNNGILVERYQCEIIPLRASDRKAHERKTTALERTILNYFPFRKKFWLRSPPAK